MRRGVLLLAFVACTTPERPAPRANVAAPTTTVLVPPPPSIPQAASGKLAPSFVHSEAGLGARLADVDGCATCHSDVASQWRKSAHAFASFNNPVYRVVVDKIRHDRGNETSQFCGGCHDTSLLVDGAMLGDIVPTDLRAHAGISCATCHSINGAHADGNASYDLDPSPIPVPKEGDASSAAVHRARVGQTTLRTAAMCGTCHKAFLDSTTGNAVHLVGQDDLTPWARSPFAGTESARIDEEIPQKDCRGCHMPRVPATDDMGAKNGTVASHWFLGSHTWLASMESDPTLLAKAQAFMQERVSLAIGGLRTQGAVSTVDLVVRNLDVGHRFPGGVMDAQDTWLELVIEDAAGRRIAEAGTQQEASGADLSAHVFASYMARADGTRLEVRETHEFRAGVWNHTIAPRDAEVVGFSFEAPANAALPLVAKARLRHRTRNLPLQKAACADTRSARGAEFGKAGLAKVARAIDACKVQPVTDLAHAELTLGTEAPPSFEREIAYGLGLSHALQEHVDDARAPYQRALALATTPRQRAIALGGLAQVAARQGRVDETFALAAKADAELGALAVAMERARAEVQASTWRLAEAAPRFLSVATRAPQDDGAWSAAAVAFGSTGDKASALRAAHEGLALQPRDGDLLRVQALSVESPEAESAFLARRTPDDAPSIRAKCSANVPGCANERIPVHVHRMRQ